MLLTHLNVHPVKSTTIRPVQRAEVLPGGLVDDRSWVVVDANGVMVTARALRGLLQITADTPRTDPALTTDLRLRAPNMPDLLVSRPQGALAPVQLFSQHLQGIPAGSQVSAWLDQALGRTGLTLLWCDDPTRRELDPRYAQDGDHTAYADSFPVTLASQSSLRQLDDWSLEFSLERGVEPPAPLSMGRFRPNLVIDGEGAFDEDFWSHIQVGDVTFRVAKPAGRCVITTIDPLTLTSGPEPILSLSRHRRPRSNTLFAIHLVPEGPGRVQVGDRVKVLSRLASADL